MNNRSGVDIDKTLDMLRGKAEIVRTTYTSYLLAAV